MADLSVNFAGIKSPNPFWLWSIDARFQDFMKRLKVERRLN